MDNAILARKPPLRRRLRDALTTDHIAALMTQDHDERLAYVEILEAAIGAGEIEPCSFSGTLLAPIDSRVKVTRETLPLRQAPSLKRGRAIPAERLSSRPIGPVGYRSKFIDRPLAVATLHSVRGEEMARWIADQGEKLARFPDLERWARNARATKKGTVQCRIDVLLRVLDRLEADGHDRWDLKIPESQLLKLSQAEASSKAEQKAHVVTVNSWRMSIYRATVGSPLYRVNKLHNRAEGQRKKSM